MKTYNKHTIKKKSIEVLIALAFLIVATSCDTGRYRLVTHANNERDTLFIVERDQSHRNLFIFGGNYVQDSVFENKGLAELYIKKMDSIRLKEKGMRFRKVVGRKLN